MRRRFGAATAGLVAAGVVLAVTAGVAGPAAPAGRPSSTPPPPSSMASLGDSFSLGWAACGTFAACPEKAWATGTDLDSHYVRLVALNPALEGNARNVAVPGSTMSSFSGQAGTATAGGFQPEYVTVMLGAGDVCFGLTPVAAFRASFRAGMDALLAASPQSKVLVASVWNFESLRDAVLARDDNPNWLALCSAFFGADGTTRALAMARIAEYNQTLADECATYANCRFDQNALFDHVWLPAEVSEVDNLHPSAAGQQMLSDVLYRAGFWGGTGASPSCGAKDNVSRGAARSGRALPPACVS